MGRLEVVTLMKHVSVICVPTCVFTCLFTWASAVDIDENSPLKASSKLLLKNLPVHNFWPWIPVFSRMSIGNTNNRTDLYEIKKRIPDHSFWPLVPIQNDWNYARVPVHNFWPYIPLQTATSGSDSSGILTPSAIPLPPTASATPLPPTSSVTPLPPWPPSLHRYNYGEVLHKSILFFEVQRSGKLPENKKITWRGDSALNDRGENGEDLTGGWYDSGDYVKFGLPMAAATSLLLYGLVEFSDTYSSLGLLDDVRDSVKWPLDYFIKAHTDKYTFYGQVGDPYVDHAYWGRPEDMAMGRPAYKLTPERPGSDLISETSAAMAAGYLAFKDVDPIYAKVLLHHAKQLFDFAERFRGLYSDSIPNAAEFYKSYNDEDELAWSALWLYRATGRRGYLARAQHWLGKARQCWGQNWADKTCSSVVLMYQLTGDVGVRTKLEKMMRAWLPGGSVPYTPKGLAFRDNWGALRYSASMSFLALVAAKAGVKPDIYKRWATGQIHYILGDTGQSYVVGFGKNPPTRPHHASSSCPLAPSPCNWDDFSKDEPNTHILYGALVGGPDIEDYFKDERDDFVHNEVSCDYNGGFQSAIVALQHMTEREF